VQCGVLIYLFVPAVRSLRRLVHVVDVFDALGVEPLFEGFGSLGGVDLNAVFPAGAAAEGRLKLVPNGHAVRNALTGLPAWD
jgi:hypothetical protein